MRTVHRIASCFPITPGDAADRMVRVLALTRTLGTSPGAVRLPQDGAAGFASRSLSWGRPLLSHGLTGREIRISPTPAPRRPQSQPSHPIRGRCPVGIAGPRMMLEIGRCGAGPELTCHMFQLPPLHFRDRRPSGGEGTGDGHHRRRARAWGWRGGSGSLEVGRRRALLTPSMPLYRVAYFASLADVKTVIVDGQVLMLDRGEALDRSPGPRLRTGELQLSWTDRPAPPGAERRKGFWGRQGFPC